MEILRRRWQRQDIEADLTRQRHTAEMAERKEVYYRLLAKGMEIEYLAAGILFSKLPDSKNVDTSTAKESAAAILSGAWPPAKTLFREFENLRARVDIIGGKSVQRLTTEWDKYLGSTYNQANLGVPINKNDPYRKLVRAIRVELSEEDNSAGTDSGTGQKAPTRPLTGEA